ncbi:MAG: replicative DNA helicase [Clostridia bacterium]|nr:replicative DNA helicase [Clostridia bacterium]
MADSNFISLENIEMPFSLEAEQAVLGCVLTEPSCLPNVTTYLRAENFYMPQHQAIFTAILTADESGRLDPLAVLDILVKNGSFESGAGKDYLFQISQMVPSTANIDTYIKIVKEKSYIRSLITLSRETIEDASSQKKSADELLDIAEQKIYDIRQGRSVNAPSKLIDIISGDVLVTLNKLAGEDKDKYKGYTTGFSDLDTVISGLNKSDLILIGARPAMGKTSFALNIARNVSAIAKKKVLFFSLEMSKEQLAQRVLATEARVSSSKMRNGNITPDEWERLITATTALCSCELYFDDTANITVTEMKAKTRKLKGVDCVIIDYLGLINSTKKSENRTNEVSDITRNLKMMAKELRIPVVCCAQLNRGTEGRGKSHRPQLSELRESGSIEQDADIVLMLYREDYYQTEKDDSEQVSEEEAKGPKTVEVIVAKNRHGETGTVKFNWDAEHTLFIGKERIHNDM